jgi:hypothetical protein
MHLNLYNEKLRINDYPVCVDLKCFFDSLAGTVLTTEFYLPICSDHQHVIQLLKKGQYFSIVIKSYDEPIEDEQFSYWSDAEVVMEWKNEGAKWKNFLVLFQYLK